MATLEKLLPDIILWGTVISLLSVVATIVAVPWVVSRLPEDYFSARRRHPLREQMGLVPLVLSLLKNLLGAALVLIGFILLFTPGQGILVALVGLLIMNFPGKFHLERALVRRESVLKGLNWLRHRQSLPPFEAPAPPSDATD